MKSKTQYKTSPKLWHKRSLARMLFHLDRKGQKLNRLELCWLGDEWIDECQAHSIKVLAGMLGYWLVPVCCMCPWPRRGKELLKIRLRKGVHALVPIGTPRDRFLLPAHMNLKLYADQEDPN